MKMKVYANRKKAKLTIVENASKKRKQEKKG
jgi:hypothetical protein